MKLSIIFPTRNEEQLIEKSLIDTCGYAKKKKYPFEILVILNGSIDRTEEKVKKLARKFHQIKILKSKAGYGYALRKGMKEAKGDYVITYNVDFYDFKLVDLVEKDMKGKDIIIGSKLARGSQDGRPFLRRLVSIMFNFYLKMTYGFKGTDTHGIKLIRKRVINVILPKCKSSSGIFDTEFVLKSERGGYEIFDIPVSIKERRPPRFSKRLLDTPRDLRELYKSIYGEH